MKTLDYLPNYPDSVGWKARHIRAINGGHVVADAIAAWIEYAMTHDRVHGSRIGDDGVLGPAWAQWGAALRVLLNGDCGTLDCGTLDTIIHDNLSEQGFNPDAL